MGILFLAVCSLFGVLAIVLWAALASTRVKLRRAEQLAADMLAVIQKSELPPAERATLALRYTMVFGEDAAAVPPPAPRT
ncbi:MAG: hypothetical protein ABW252_23460 [Polyangiales bacterium]